MPKRHTPPISLSEGTGLSDVELAKLTRPRKSFPPSRSVTVPSGFILWCSGRHSRVIHVFMAIAWLINNQTHARLSIDAISIVVSMSPRSVHYAIYELVVGGWVKRKQVKTASLIFLSRTAESG